MKIKTSLALILLTATITRSAPDEPSYPVLTVDSKKEMIQSFMFCEGQKTSVITLSKNFPELNLDLNRAQNNFDRNFLTATNTIDAVLKKEIAIWDSMKPQLLDTTRKQLSSSAVSKNQALQFIEEINSRSTGNIPSPIIETLLMYNPTFIRHPEKIYDADFVNVFNTRGHKKSQGLNIRVKYPKSWSVEEGDRPHVIKVFTSENGRGKEVACMMIKNPPDSIKGEFNDNSVKSMFSREKIKDLVPDGCNYISGKPVTLDGLEGAMVTFSKKGKRLDVETHILMTEFVTVYDKKVIYLQCAVLGESGAEKKVKLKMKTFTPLFREMAKSLVLENQWK